MTTPTLYGLCSLNPELKSVAKAMLGPYSGYAPAKSTPTVLIGHILPSALVQTLRRAHASNIELVLLDIGLGVGDNKLSSLKTTIRNLPTTILESLKDNYHARFITVNSRDVGSIYRFKRVLFLWANPSGLQRLTLLPNVDAIKAQAQWLIVGKSEREEAFARLTRLSTGQYLDSPYIKALKLWEQFSGPMPIMQDRAPWNLSPRWLGWSMGHGVPLSRDKPLAAHCIPHLSLYGLALLIPGAQGAWSEPELFPQT